jgi:hypothetical protein
MPKVTISLNDSYGRTARKVVEIDEQATIADYITATQSYVNALQAVTDLGAVRVDLILEGIVSGFAVTAGANVDTGATFSGYIQDGDGKKASHKVPGIKPALVNPDGSVPLAGATATYLQEFENGEDFLLSDGEQISSWIKGTLDR